MKLFLVVLTVFFLNSSYSQDFNSQIDAFKSNLKTVKGNKEEFSQSVTVIEPAVIKVTIEKTSSKDKATLVFFEFNPSDINKGSIKKVVKKDVVYMHIKTKSKQKLIKKTTNNEKVSYVDNIKIYAEGIENARELVSSFSESIPLAKIITDARLNLSTYDEYLNWLKNNISDVNLPILEITQQIKENSDYIGSITYNKTITKKATDKTSFVFNLLTLNSKAIDYKVVGETFNISLETNKSKKSIKYFEEGAQKKFINKFLIACNTIEQSKDLIKVLKGIIPLAKEKFMGSIKPVVSINEGFTKINSLIGSFEVNNESIKQYFTGDCIANFDLSIDADKSENYHYDFNYSDIDVKKIDHTSKDNFLTVNLVTKGKEPFIKLVEDGEKSSYIKVLKLYVPSIEKTLILEQYLRDILKLCE